MCWYVHLSTYARWSMVNRCYLSHSASKGRKARKALREHGERATIRLLTSLPFSQSHSLNAVINTSPLVSYSVLPIPPVPPVPSTSASAHRDAGLSMYHGPLVRCLVHGAPHADTVPQCSSTSTAVISAVWIAPTFLQRCGWVSPCKRAVRAPGATGFSCLVCGAEIGRPRWIVEISRNPATCRHADVRLQPCTLRPSQATYSTPHTPSLNPPTSCPARTPLPDHERVALHTPGADVVGCGARPCKRAIWVQGMLAAGRDRSLWCVALGSGVR